MNAIEAKNISFCYNRIPVLESLTFTVKDGGFTAVVGSNGTGKSTLVKLIMGQLSPHTGEILIFGEKQGSFKKWSEIGYVPQVTYNSGTSFPATCEEIVEMSLYSQVGFMRPFKKHHKEMALSALSLTGAREFAKKQFSTLSGGQQQRVMIAKALANNPRLLILDEPTTGIDSAAQESLLKLLAHLNKDHGMTILMITHDFAKIEAITTDTLILSDVLSGEAKHHDDK